MTPLSQLNLATREQFVAICGPLFELSPWIAERTFDRTFSPSTGIPGEGRGEGDFERRELLDRRNHPHPDPLPDYRERGPNQRFASVDTLHAALVQTMYAATPDEQLRLISSHPDLVGRLAREGKLTRESTNEQKSAGLTTLTEDEIAAFNRYNATYREKFGFPFVICARENKRETILAAFPIRLQHTREQEIQTALIEIAKIARLRLYDAVSDE